MSEGHGHSHGGVPCHGHGAAAQAPAGGGHGHSHGAPAAAGDGHGHSHGGVPCHGHGAAAQAPAAGGHGHSHGGGGGGGGHGHSHGGVPCNGHHGPQQPQRRAPQPRVIACAACGQQAPATRCSKCQLAWYCSRECQTAHWSSHKRACKAAVPAFPAIEGELEFDEVLRRLKRVKSGLAKEAQAAKKAGSKTRLQDVVNKFMRSVTPDDISPDDADTIIPALLNADIPGSAQTREYGAMKMALATLYDYQVTQTRGLTMEARRDLQELALQHLACARPVFAREGVAHSNPLMWGSLVAMGAGLYASRIAGDLRSNLEQAIAHCEAALLVYHPEVSFDHWLQSHQALASCYLRRVAGSKRGNIDEALNHFMMLSHVLSQNRASGFWAENEQKIAKALLSRASLGPAAGAESSPNDDVKQAIEHLLAAAEVFTHERAAPRWAYLMHAVGNALYGLEGGEGEGEGREQLLQRSVSHYLQALEVWTEDKSPEPFRIAQRNMALATAALENPTAAIFSLPAPMSIEMPEVSSLSPEELVEAKATAAEAAAATSPSSSPEQAKRAGDALYAVPSRRVAGEEGDESERAAWKAEAEERLQQAEGYFNAAHGGFVAAAAAASGEAEAEAVKCALECRDKCAKTARRLLNLTL